MRKVLKVIPAIRDDIADLITKRAMPTKQLEMIDPFLFLNHHGPQVYREHNRGLPFGPHPHRGFETVTFIIEGDIAHRDSAGNESVIEAGGVQWMTAGRGLIHEEVSSESFKKKGGPLEILQLWVNLPSSRKMTTSSYKGVQKESIPLIEEDGVAVELISGAYKNHQGFFNSLTDVTSMLVSMKEGSSADFTIPHDRNIFLYVIAGLINIHGTEIKKEHTAILDNHSSDLKIQSIERAKILLCHARPLNEPVVSYGPFVMNTRDEINEAISDCQSGRLK